ncbi:MAG TPA: hypothetical protein VFX33_04265 [Actinomycetales bacterium]|nr:hypothetical protein [Actinomycetales bacterium]
MSTLIPDPGDLTTFIVGGATDPLWGIHQGVAVLRNVHSPTRCTGKACVVHNTTDHHMREWPLTWRGDLGTFERLCPHGIGHPDPDALGCLVSTQGPTAGIHGCDDCCLPPSDDGISAE